MLDLKVPAFLWADSPKRRAGDRVVRSRIQQRIWRSNGWEIKNRTGPNSHPIEAARKNRRIAKGTTLPQKDLGIEGREKKRGRLGVISFGTQGLWEGFQSLDLEWKKTVKKNFLRKKPVKKENAE